MSSFMDKISSARGSSTKPVLQKLYAAPKKWLISNTHKKSSSKPDLVLKSAKQVQNVVKVHVNLEHPYENVDFAKVTPQKPTVVTNVTVIEVGEKQKSDGKLRSAIDNFDKILSEYGTKQKPRTMPKLQKSRTCSIIESKCILKQSSGQGLDKKSSRSLENLTQHSPSLDKIKPASNSRVLPKTPPSAATTMQSPAKPQALNKNSNNRTKVKEAVKKINSLSDDSSKTSPTKDQNVQVKRETSRKLSLPKSVSSLDISCESSKKNFASKIPVKAALNRSFPSTPTGLNTLDRNKLGSTLQKQGLNGRLTESAQNLRNIGPSSAAPAKIATKTNQLSGKTFRVQKMVKASSVHNLGSKFAKLELTNSVEPKSSLTKKEAPISDKTELKPAGKTIPKKQQMGGKTEPDGSRSDKPPKPKLVEAPKKPPKDENTFGAKKWQFEPKFINISSNPSENKKVEVLQKSATFKKSLVSAESSRFVTYSKSSFSRMEKIGLESPRKLNQLNSINFVEKCETISHKSHQQSHADLIVEDVLVNLTAKEVKVGGGKDETTDFDNGDVLIADQEKMATKVRDYTSDDNSDDSGNISNEHIADLSSLTSSSRNNSFESLPSISRINAKNSGIFTELDNSQDRSIDEEEIFFRSGVLTQLETQRDERLAGMVVHLQSQCRGYLARKKLTQRKLQDLAVRCVQRNVRKFMVVRDWPWWRLLVRVTPLLNVHRTEEELRNKTEELELLRSKVDKLESERTTLKHDNDKLEAKLSELTADLAEEHSTSTLAAERLDAETSERMRIERELSEVQNKNKSLRDSSERLEMELMYAKSELNGISEEDEDGDNDGSIYKQRYERAKKELEFTKRRLQQQHEDDLEQLVGLKKQLEKKLTDAYEEVEEQRQVVGQWKRKVQKLNSETNDLRLLLEEQNARNNLLEKKQRKFDAETQLLQDELRQEKQAKDRFSREKEAILAEKFTIEGSLADARLELDLKEDKLQSVQRELDELTYGGKTEEEVAILRKQKIDCERRLHDQDEELDELAGQVQLLEQAKLRLEMTLESQRKEGKREAQQRDEELEEVRCNAQKKVKALEAQLENEHEERTILLREKHELERRLTAVTECERNERAGDEALLHRLKRDLKRTKALLRDTQSQLERQKAESPGKALIRQLRNQVEDLECARSVAVKSKQSLEADLGETQATLEEANKQKSEAEDKVNVISRERSDLQAQIEENEEELAEVMKKYKAVVQQMSLDQLALQEQVSLVSELETERNHLRDQLSELASKLESVENMGEASSNLHLKRMELKTKELESKLELEQTTRSRLEVQIARLKEAVDKLQTDVCTSRTKEQVAQEQIRKLQRSLRELKEEHNKSLSKEAEFMQKRKDLEKRCEIGDTEVAAAKADLKLALKRIEDLQSAIQGELEDTNSENTDSEQDSYTSDESVNTFLSNSKLTSSSTMKSDRNSIQFDSRRLSSASRSSTSSSIQGKDYSYA